MWSRLSHFPEREERPHIFASHICRWVRSCLSTSGAEPSCLLLNNRWRTLNPPDYYCSPCCCSFILDRLNSYVCAFSKFGGDKDNLCLLHNVSDSNTTLWDASYCGGGFFPNPEGYP